MKRMILIICLLIIAGCSQVDPPKQEEVNLQQTPIQFEEIVLPKSILLEVPYYNQHALHVPLGCEAICLYSALKYNQLNLDLQSFLDGLPYSEENPHLGFVGSIYGPRVEGKLPAIYPDALKIYGDQFMDCINISGSNLFEFKLALYQQFPILVWVTTSFQEPSFQQFSFGKAIENTHTVLLVGYDENGFIYHDPNTQGNLHISYEKFNEIYEVSQMAMQVGK